MGEASLSIGYLDPALVGWRDMLASALCRGAVPMSEVEDCLSDNTMQLIGITKGGDPHLLACAVIRSAVTREGEDLEIVAASGRNHRLWAAWGMAALRRAAQEAGMQGVRFMGRRGWRRVFPNAVQCRDSFRMAA